MTRAAGRHTRAARPHSRRPPYAVAAAAVAGLIAVVTASWLGVARAASHRPPGREAGCAVSATLVPSCGPWWGMYLPTASDSGLIPAVAAEEHAIGRPLAILERYHDMSTSPDGVFPGPAERQLARNHLLLFAWAPAVWADHSTYQWRTVASGALDRSVVIPEARRLKAFGRTVFLTFSTEPDGAVPGLGAPADFVAAWRHLHDVFARLGVRNVVWVWNTEGYLPHAATIAALYPGSAYVDWVGYDPYNYFTCHGTGWLSFTQTVTPFYRWLMSRGFGVKPLMLTEYGSVADPRDPGREADWYRSIPAVLAGLPHIRAVIQWNAATGGCDLRLPVASPAGRAYRQAGLSPYLGRDLP